MDRGAGERGETDGDGGDEGKLDEGLKTVGGAE